MKHMTDWQQPEAIGRKQKKPYVIFYGAGGGVRALLPLGVLAKIREMRQSHFIHGVDCLTGPSTAAIYTSGFNREDPKNSGEPLHSEQDMIDMYRNACPKIFDLHHIRRHFPGYKKLTGRNKYDPAVLEKFLHQLIGDMPVSGGLKSHLIPAKALKGRNIRFKAIKEAPKHNFYPDTPMYQAAMASAMHPGCFPSYHLKTSNAEYDFIDGGLFEHPYFVYQEIKRVIPEDREIHMVFMSTGIEPKHGFDKSMFDLASLTQQFSLRHGMPLAAEKTTAVDQEAMKNLRAELGSRFIELEFHLEDVFPQGSVPIVDDVTPETLEAYYSATDRLIESRIDTIRQICDLLNNRETWEMEQKMVTHQIVQAEPKQDPSIMSWLSSWVPAFGHRNNTAEEPSAATPNSPVLH